MRHLHEQGPHTGGHVPIRFELGVDGTLVSVPAEQAAVDLAHDLRARGITFWVISAELATADHRNRAGRAHHRSRFRGG